MSSAHRPGDVVEVINSLRGPAKHILRHDSFLAKVGKVLGNSGQRFLGAYFDHQNKQRPCYYLPKREAVLMVNC